VLTPAQAKATFVALDAVAADRSELRSALQALTFKTRALCKGGRSLPGARDERAKTRIVPPAARHVILGLLVDHDRVRLQPEYKRRIDIGGYPTKSMRCSQLAVRMPNVRYRDRVNAMEPIDTTAPMVQVRSKAGAHTKLQRFSKSLWGRRYLLDVAAQIARDHIGTDEPLFSATCLSEAGDLTPQKAHVEVTHLARSGLLKLVARAGRHYYRAVPSEFWAWSLRLVEDESEQLDVTL
jgi:hypothetical protein